VVPFADWGPAFDHSLRRIQALQEKAIRSGLTVASERQIAAIRRNARKGTGPRSSAGKRRTSRNPYRHGFSANMTSSGERTKHIERLARKIAGNATDVVILERARAPRKPSLISRRSGGSRSRWSSACWRLENFKRHRQPTLKNWEQGRRAPDAPAAAYLLAIQRRPKEVMEAVAS